MPSSNNYLPSQVKLPLNPNRWDLVALCLIVGLFILFNSGAQQMVAPFHLGHTLPISLAPMALPGYALQTLLRMVIALGCSLVFTFTLGTWAAKSRQAEKLIIPMIDILQSVPVLAFLSLTIVGFIRLFPNSMLGPQCAAIFLIFTAQAWNMALSFYQSLRALPEELKEAADMFHLSAWQRFWRIEVPYSIPGLLWNTMMSMSASWFSVVASEAISVSEQAINLPGIGSYIAEAIHHANTQALIYAIIAMLLVILVYDQLLFRPLLAWAEKFRFDQATSEKQARSWVIVLLQRTAVVRYLGQYLTLVTDAIINFKPFRRRFDYRAAQWNPVLVKRLNLGWNLLLMLLLGIALIAVTRFVLQQLSIPEVLHVFGLGMCTAIRVLVLIVLCSIVWVPIGVWIGLRPQAAEIVQPIAQFLAAFPANLLFPAVVIVILKFKLNVEIWTTPLMILGTQWYVLFNVIAGATAIPKELRQVAASFNVRGWLWWRRLILPSIFPYYITGAITAAGGAWNASLVTEVVTWGNTTLKATGLGAYITEYTGDMARTILGVTVMCIFVLSLNYLVWRRLYNYAVARFQL